MRRIQECAREPTRCLLSIDSLIHPHREVAKLVSVAESLSSPRGLAAHCDSARDPPIVVVEGEHGQAVELPLGVNLDHVDSLRFERVDDVADGTTAQIPRVTQVVRRLLSL